MGAIPQEIYQAVSPAFSSYGVPDYIWQSIAAMETGGTFNTKALGDNGKSFGLFQLYTAGGQGDPYASDPDVLYDPGFNAQVAAPEIARGYYLGLTMGIPEGPELAAFTAANSGHPGYNLPMDDTAVSRVRNYASTYFNTTAAPGGQVGQPGGAQLENKHWWSLWTDYWQDRANGDIPGAGVRPPGSAPLPPQSTPGGWWDGVKSEARSDIYNAAQKAMPMVLIAILGFMLVAAGIAAVTKSVTD